MESKKFFFAYSTPYRVDVTTHVSLSLKEALKQALATKKSLQVLHPNTQFYIASYVTRSRAISKRHYLVVTSKNPAK